MTEKDNKAPMASWHLGVMLHNFEAGVQSCGDADVRSRYDTLCEEYRYMLEYFVGGIPDPQRTAMLQSMTRRAFVLGTDIRMIEMFRSNNSYAALRKSIVTENVSTMSIIEDLRRSEVSAREHYDYLNKAFLAIFFSLSWREQDSRLWTAFLIADNVSPVDAQTIVSAITLSCIHGFCLEKFRTLVYTYLASRDEQVRLRALTGCLFNFVDRTTLPFAAEYDAIVADLFSDEDTEKAMMESVLLVIHSSEAEADNRKVQEEIIPELMKSARFTITPDGIREKKEDSIDEILNPGKYDKEMERLESSIEKMRRLHSDGADVFYSGFRMMKRYPFFYKLYNWFVPFVTDHPDLVSAQPDADKMKFVETLADNASLCDSDKYSFVFAFQSLLPTLPKEIREAVINGGDMIGIPALLSKENTAASLSNERRMYLQNFYRFFKLNPQVRMANVFEERTWFANLVTLDVIGMESRVELCRFLLRRRYYDEAFLLARHIEMYNMESGVLLAAIDIEKGDTLAAIDKYDRVLEMEADCKTALYGIASQSFLNGDYSSSHKAFARLASLYPDHLPYQINRLMSGVMCGKAEELLNDVYRLDFEHEENASIKRLLAWTLLCLGRFEQSLAIYKKILRSSYGDATENDMLCLMDLYWVWGDVKSCVETVARYRADYMKDMGVDESDSSLRAKLMGEAHHLQAYYPHFMDGTDLLIDAVLCLQSLSSSDG